MQLERLECKAAFTADETGLIEGKAWDFATPDRVGDVIEPQAFASAIGKSLPMLYGHDKPVGVWSNIAVDGEGLKVKGRLLVEDVPEAKSARALVRAGGVTGLSVGFVTKKSAPRKGGGRTISDLDLVEVSIVAVPAHAAARITSSKDLLMTDTTIEKPEAKPEAKASPAVDTKALDAITARLDAMETKLARPAIVTGKGDEPSEDRKAFTSYLRLGNQTPADEMKALTVSSDPQAGYLAPAEMSTEFIRDLVEFSPIRSYASVRTTGSPSVKYPRRTGITNAQWEGELEESDESDVSFGMLEVPVHGMRTFVDISNELLADSGGQAETEVRLALAEDFGQKEAVSFVSGSGVKQPEGFMSHADIQHTVNGHATNLSADKLIDLLYALPAAYRNASTAAWAMNGTTLAAVRKLKDGQNNYLWQPSYQAGQPETILGKPVVEMVDMPDIGDGEFPIIYGDFSAYRIVDRLALSILSDPYTQARRGVTRIHATRRTAGRVLQAARFRKLKTATS